MWKFRIISKLTPYFPCTYKGNVNIKKNIWIENWNQVNGQVREETMYNFNSRYQKLGCNSLSLELSTNAERANSNCTYMRLPSICWRIDHENPKLFTMILYLSNSGEYLMIKQRILHIIPSTTIWFLQEFLGLAILDAAVHVRERKLLKFLVTNEK